MLVPLQLGCLMTQGKIDLRVDSQCFPFVTIPFQCWLMTQVITSFIAMDFVSTHCVSSDESSCGDSSGPTTPVYSPLIRPFVMKSGTSTLAEQLFELENKTAISSLYAPAERKVTEQDSDKPVIRSVCFIGAGYVGGPTAAIIALNNPGLRVEVVDKNEMRIKQWRSKHLPIHEPGLHDIVRICRDGAQVRTSSGTEAEGILEDVLWDRQPNLFFSTDVSGSISRSDMIFLAVNTSTKTFGIGSGRATDMSACDAATKEIAAHARPGTIIVEKSTVPCGTAQRIVSTLNSLRPGAPFEVLSNPEFLAEGSAINDLMKPDRVIIGLLPTIAGRTASNVLANLYSAWVPRDRILTSNVWSSELSKLVANAMLAQRISSINSISAICEQTGADVEEIARCIGKDSRIGPEFLKAGLGFGGSCFRKDISSLTYLAESLGLDEVAEYWSQVNRMNQFQHRRFAKMVINRLGQNLVGKKIAILGFAFKADTGDPRESLAAEVIKDLLIEHPAEIAIFDPFCKETDILREIQTSRTVNATTVGVSDCPYKACFDADAVLIATDCDHFRSHRQLRQKTLVQKQQAITLLGQEITIQQDSKQTRYIPTVEPDCAEDCRSCLSLNQTSKTGTSGQPRALDWFQIVNNLKRPRWIFDGRNVIDMEEIHGFGVEVNVESIGKRRAV